VAVLVAVDEAPVGEHGARGDELVGGEAVRAAEDAEAAAEGQAGDADGWPAARGHREIVGSERVVDVGKARPGAHGDRAVGDRHLLHAAHIDDDAGRRRASSEAVAAAAQRDVQPFLSCRREDVCDVLGHLTTRHRTRTHAVKARDLRPARRLVRGRARDQHLSADRHLLSMVRGRSGGRRRGAVDVQCRACVVCLRVDELEPQRRREALEQGKPIA
jgi:hypothetical protein